MNEQDLENRCENIGAMTEGTGRNPEEYVDGGSNISATADQFLSPPNHLIQAVVARENMFQALKRVERNKGAAGPDGMPHSELRPFLIKNWNSIKIEILEGRYQPQAVKRVEIPKPEGGMRKLGIPAVVDRLIQQALHQVLSPIFEQDFSESSYGFRPGRSAHDAVKTAQSYAKEGRRFVVDLDLDSFFDRVNHDILMSRIARKVTDKKVLLLIRRYLQSGALVDGIRVTSEEGTPQGGPLSPLLSNILLNDLDKELHRRGHKFCRYADDVNIYVKSAKSGERTLASVTHFLEEKLKLKVNSTKSQVDRPWNRKFLGYSMTWHKSPRLKVAPQSIRRFKGKIRSLFRAGRGRNLGRFVNESLNPLLRGWANYFSLSETKKVIKELDEWIRHRIRCMLWRQWKKPKTRFKRMVSLGLKIDHARSSSANGRGPWWNSGASHMNRAIRKGYLDKIGLISLLNQMNRVPLT